MERQNIVSVDLNTKTAEQHVYKAGGAKLETSPSSADNENQGASKSPEGIQEKPQSKNDKGKKLKLLASFGRNKKKYEIAFELDETSNETHEENLVDTPGRFKRSRSTSSQPFQNTEIVGSESKEPVAAASSDFNNKNTSDEKDEGTEIEKKRGGKQKKKGRFLVLGAVTPSQRKNHRKAKMNKTLKAIQAKKMIMLAPREVDQWKRIKLDLKKATKIPKQMKQKHLI